MLDAIYHLSDLTIFLILNGSAILISIIAIYIVKFCLPLHLRYQDNQVIGTTAALISVIYGVLAGLTAVYLINNNNYTADAIQREANAVANIYRDSSWLGDPTKTTIKNDLKQYLNGVIHTEWELMETGSKLGGHGEIIINHIFNALKNYDIKTSTDSLIITDILTEIKSLYNARQQRIQMSYTQLDPAIWIVVIIGTVLTLCINYLFGMNFYLHLVMVVSAAMMTSSMVFLLIALDRPFQGEHIIEPDALHTVVKFINDNEDMPKNF